MSINLIQRFSLQPLGKTPLPLMKDGFHLTTLSSILRRRSSLADTRAGGHRESAWRSLDIPGKSHGIVFTLAPAGRLPTLEALVPSSRVALPESGGFPSL